MKPTPSAVHRSAVGAVGAFDTEFWRFRIHAILMLPQITQQLNHAQFGLSELTKFQLNHIEMVQTKYVAVWSREKVTCP